MSDVIQCEGVRTRVGERSIHNGLDLRVCRGEVVAVAGDNGSGKTTLLRVLLGLQSIDQGRVSLNGCAPPYSRGALSAVGAMIGDAPVLPWMRPRAYLKMLLETAGESDRGRSSAALERVGLDSDHLRTRLGRMSQGERQLVAIAATVVRSPVVLLLDEPYAHLDQSHVSMLDRLVTGFAADRGAALFTTHRVSEATLADRLLVLLDGQLTQVEPDSELARSVLR